MADVRAFDTAHVLVREKRSRIRMGVEQLPASFPFVFYDIVLPSRSLQVKPVCPYTSHAEQPNCHARIFSAEPEARLEDMLGAMPEKRAGVIDVFKIISNMGAKVPLQPYEIIAAPETAVVGEPSQRSPQKAPFRHTEARLDKGIRSPNESDTDAEPRNHLH